MRKVVDVMAGKWMVVRSILWCEWPCRSPIPECIITGCSLIRVRYVLQNRNLMADIMDGVWSLSLFLPWKCIYLCS